MKVDAMKARQLSRLRVIADDDGDRAVELAILMSVQQVGKAVELLRYEDGHPYRRLRQLEPPPHFQLHGKALEAVLKARQIEIIEPPLDPHEEQAGFVILMLIGVHDVGAALVEKHRDTGDQALSIGAVDEERGGGHQEMLNAEC